MINDKNKNSWCVNAFHGISGNNDGTTKMCCMYTSQDYSQVLGIQPLQDHFNKPEFLEVRNDLENGIKHNNCKLCWVEEDSGRTSKRMRDNDKYQKYLFHNSPYNGLSYLELNLGNNCNLACRTCGPTISSGWMKEEYDTNKITMMSYKEYAHSMKKYHQSYSEDSNFWEELKKQLPNVRQFDFYGGEPFMSKKMWELLNVASNTGVSKNIELHYNTNGTHLPLEDMKVWKNFRKINLSFSIDGINEVFEHMRYPAKWDNVLENMNKFVDLGNEFGNIHMSWCITLSVSNIFNAAETIEFYQKHFSDKMGMYLNLVHGPESHNISMLPDNIKLAIKEKLESVPSEYVTAWQHIPGVIAFMNSSSYNEKAFQEFLKNTQNSDNYRSQNFYQTFAEYGKYFVNI
jgi:organic radical activating enzyme